MNDRIESFERIRVDAAGRGIPRDFIGRARFGANEAMHGVPSCPQERNEPGADETARAGNRNALAGLFIEAIVCIQIVARYLMPVNERAIQLILNPAANRPVSKGTQRNLVTNPVFERNVSIRLFGKPVLVRPVSERTRGLPVEEAGAAVQGVVHD